MIRQTDAELAFENISRLKQSPRYRHLSAETRQLIEGSADLWAAKQAEDANIAARMDLSEVGKKNQARPASDALKTYLGKLTGRQVALLEAPLEQIQGIQTGRVGVGGVPQAPKENTTEAFERALLRGDIRAFAADQIADAHAAGRGRPSVALRAYEAGDDLSTDAILNAPAILGLAEPFERDVIGAHRVLRSGVVSTFERALEDASFLEMAASALAEAIGQTSWLENDRKDLDALVSTAKDAQRWYRRSHNPRLDPPIEAKSGADPLPPEQAPVRIAPVDARDPRKYVAAAEEARMKGVDLEITGEL